MRAQGDTKPPRFFYMDLFFASLCVLFDIPVDTYIKKRTGYIKYVKKAM